MRLGLPSLLDRAASCVRIRVGPEHVGFHCWSTISHCGISSLTETTGAEETTFRSLYDFFTRIIAHDRRSLTGLFGLLEQVLACGSLRGAGGLGVGAEPSYTGRHSKREISFCLAFIPGLDESRATATLAQVTTRLKSSLSWTFSSELSHPFFVLQTNR